MTGQLIGGAAEVDVTPADSQFLFGYPHVRRWSTGVHDPLVSSALYLSDGHTPLVWVANDVIFISRDSAQRTRDRIAHSTGVPVGNIMVTATHTHSGPLVADMLSNESDPCVGKTDPRYLQRLEEGIVEAARRAAAGACPVSVALALADGSCVGSNRHDPAGPSDPEVPVLVVRDREAGTALALMLVCSVHPTVLHEDSTLVSADFPGMTRRYLKQYVLGSGCVVLHHTGPSGNQSPRHVARANSFEEAVRLGEALGKSIARAVDAAEELGEVRLGCAGARVELPPRLMPAVREAEKQHQRAVARLETLRRSGAPRGEVRTAECDGFGAEEGVALARAAADGRLVAAVNAAMPAEVQVMRVGRWSFVGWPGECYVEFALDVKRRCPGAYVISLANGELQGYLVTEEAVHRGSYEALNALFASPASGEILVWKTLELLADVEPQLPSPA